MKIKKGDNIIVISGKDRGKSGTVLRAMPKQGKVVIEGVNVVKKHQRPRRAGQAGQVIEHPMPIDVSNIAIKDSASGKPSRVGYTVEDGKKKRVLKKSGVTL